MHAEQRHGFEGEGFVYLRSPLWWAGIVCLVLGEVFNFAAYAFAPAILVTPLGALSVLIGAILGAYFLGEELGTLGKLGSAICLIGAVIIVLHAPPDKEIETIDEILHYAIQPGVFPVGRLVMYEVVAHTYPRIPHLHHRCLHFRYCHDLQGCSCLREEESPDLPQYLLDRRLHFRHVSQGLWHCPEVDLRRQQPIHASVDLRLYDCHWRLHFDPDELLQQGP